MGYGEDFAYGEGFYKGTTFDFSGNVVSGHAPTTVQFQTLSNDVFNMVWYFGDGNTSTERNPIHTYGMPGTYTVRLKATGEATYDETKSDLMSITDFDSSFDASGTTKSYRYAIEPQQGVNWAENTGVDWVFPPGRVKSIKIKDNNDIFHTCLMDVDDEKIYILDTKNCPSELSSSKIWVDKQNVSGTAGTYIGPEALFKEDIGEYEKFTIENIESQYYLRPYSETDGYDSSLKVSGNAYINGEPATTAAEAKDIGPSGITVFDRKVEARRIQHEFKASDSRIRLVGRQHEYIRKDITYDRSNTISTEDGWQANISDVALWLSRGENPTTERVSGATVEGLSATITGPDTREYSAFEVSGAVTLPSLTDTSEKTIFMWTSGSISGIIIDLSLIHI